MSPAERAFAEAHLGPLTEVVGVGWPGGPNRVWRLVGGRGTAYFKGFAGQRAFDRERRALADWGPALPAAPRVLAADD
ncbi:MAG: hypothetical protein KC620_10460, partial [Myxococcales bacterium]|nr:hypothetical protein [Myxococcales bacterium]